MGPIISLMRYYKVKWSVNIVDFLPDICYSIPVRWMDSIGRPGQEL